MPKRTPDNRRRPAVAAGLLAGVLGLLMCAACSSLESIDARVERIVGARADAIGAVPARAERRSVPELDPERLDSEEPGTVNPDASEFDYTGASTRVSDVLDRLNSFYLRPENAVELDLAEAFRLAQSTAREFRSAEEDYILAAISLIIEERNWNPRFFNTLSATVDGDDPSDGQYTAALNLINQLGVRQRLPYGGEVEARLVTNAARELIGSVSPADSSAQDLIISADIPLLRGAGKTAREDLIQSRRDIVYAAREFERFRREFLVDIATDYFDLVNSLQSVQSLRSQLNSIRSLYDQRRDLVTEGRVAPFERKNVEQQLLSSRVNLLSALESYTLRLDQFKIRLGLDVTTPVTLIPQIFSLEDPEATVDSATEAALAYRLDYQTQIDVTDDSRRAVRVARNNVLPDLDINLSTGVSTGSAGDFGNLDSVDFDDTDFSAGIVFDLPLDRDVEYSLLRASMIDLQRAIRSLDLFRDNLILEARTSFRDIKQSRFAVALQQRALEINLLRREELQEKTDADVQTQLDAEDDILDSQNALNNATADLQTAILNYLLSTGQLRVEDDGQFRPLPGMRITVQLLEGLQDEAFSKPSDSIQDAIPDIDADTAGAQDQANPPDDPAGNDG